MSKREEGRKSRAGCKEPAVLSEYSKDAGKKWVFREHLKSPSKGESRYAGIGCCCRL